MTCPGREVPGRNIHTRTQPTLTDQAREGRDHGGGSTNTPLSPLSFVLTSLGLCSCASALCLALGPKWCPPRAVARATWTPSPPNVQVRHLRVLAGLYPDRPPALRFWAAGSKKDRRTLPQVSKSRAHPPHPPARILVCQHLHSCPGAAVTKHQNPGGSGSRDAPLPQLWRLDVLSQGVGRVGAF